MLHFIELNIWNLKRNEKVKPSTHSYCNVILTDHKGCLIQAARTNVSNKSKVSKSEYLRCHNYTICNSFILFLCVLYSLWNLRKTLLTFSLKQSSKNILILIFAIDAISSWTSLCAVLNLVECNLPGITHMISNQNCTPLSSVATLLHPFWNRTIQDFSHYQFTNKGQRYRFKRSVNCVKQTYDGRTVLFR